jgi:hypothetical protein
VRLQPQGGGAVNAVAAMLESAWQTRVTEYALLKGWRVAHVRPTQVRKGRFATATHPHPGLPDLILARKGVVILAELKRDHTYPTVEQRLWLAALGEYGRIWRPRDWDDVQRELT